MIDHAFRRALPQYVGPLVRWLASRGITPTALTAAAFVLGAIAAWLLALGAPWTAYLVWLASRLLDGLDGILARETRRATALGGYLDITLDMAAYGLMIVAFAHVHPAHGVLWSAILVGYILAITTTLALSSLLERQARLVPGNDRSLQMTRGIAEGGETTIVYGLMILWPAQVAVIGWVWVVMLVLTAVVRTREARRVLD